MIRRAILLVGARALQRTWPVLAGPVQVDVENSVLFGLAFLIDGAVRIAAALVVRFPQWRLIAAGGVLELGFAAVAFSGWPVSYHRTVPFFLGVALLLSGWTVVRLGLMLRRLTDRTPVLSRFDPRGWHRRGVPWPAGEPTAARRHERPLVVPGDDLDRPRGAGAGFRPLHQPLPRGRDEPRARGARAPAEGDAGERRQGARPGSPSCRSTRSGRAGRRGRRARSRV